jgi:hypothetical protein
MYTMPIQFSQTVAALKNHLSSVVEAERLGRAAGRGEHPGEPNWKLIAYTTFGASAATGGIAAAIVLIALSDKRIERSALARSALQRSRVGVLGAPPPLR